MTSGWIFAVVAGVFGHQKHGWLGAVVAAAAIPILTIGASLFYASKIGNTGRDIIDF